MNEKIIALIGRLMAFAAHFRSLEPNRHPYRIFRPLLPERLRLTQEELVEAFGAKSPKALSRNLRQAIVVVARVHKGTDSHRTIADKAETLTRRLRELHGLRTETKTAMVIVEAEESPEETEAERLERLANEQLAHALREECVELQRQCWKLGCELDLRDACPMLPRGFKSLDVEGLEKLKAGLDRKFEAFTTEAETRKRLIAEVEAEEEARALAETRELEELQALYEECRRLVRELVAFASSKRVRIQRIELPSPARVTKAELEDARRKLKSFRLTIEQRARELDPKRSRVRVTNPSALASPLAA